MTDVVVWSGGNLVEVVVPSAADYAYLAGVIDADGTIYLGKRGPEVRVTNTSRTLLDWINERWPGSLNEERGYHRDGYIRRTAWRWTISGGRARALLREVRGSLVIKTDRAIAAIGESG